MPHGVGTTHPYVGITVPVRGVRSGPMQHDLLRAPLGRHAPSSNVCYCPVPCPSMEDTSPAHLPETLSGPWQGLMMLIRCVRLACQPPCALPRHYFPRGGCKSGSWIDACAELGGRFGHLPFLLPWTTWRLPPPNSGDNRRVIYLRHCRMLLAARR